VAGARASDASIGRDERRVVFGEEEIGELDDVVVAGRIPSGGGGRGGREHARPRVQRVELALAEEVLGGARSISSARRWRCGRRALQGFELHLDAPELPLDAVALLQQRPDARLGHDDGVDSPAGRERDLVEHREVRRVADEDGEASIGEEVRHHVVPVGDVGAEERERLRSSATSPESAAAGGAPEGRARASSVTVPISSRFVPEPPAEDDLVPERALTESGSHVRPARGAAEAWHGADDT
jgi:hypothetical protein